MQWQQGEYVVKNKHKFKGRSNPVYKSSWELRMMTFLDERLEIELWAYEPFSIPYVHPLTHRRSNYWPDFLVKYTDKSGQAHVDLLEVKPASQAFQENVGKSQKNQADFVVNNAKWEAARLYAKMKGMNFRVVDESQIYVNQQTRNNKKRNTKSRVPKRKR